MALDLEGLAELVVCDEFFDGVVPLVRFYEEAIAFVSDAAIDGVVGGNDGGSGPVILDRSSGAPVFQGFDGGFGVIEGVCGEEGAEANVYFHQGGDVVWVGDEADGFVGEVLEVIGS